MNAIVCTAPVGSGSIVDHPDGDEATDRSMSDIGLWLRELGSDVSDPMILAVLRHWHQARGDREMPVFEKIDPTGLAAALPNIWVYQRTGEDFVCVLAGEKVQEAWGRRITGLMLSELTGPSFPELRDRWFRILSEPVMIYGTRRNDSSGVISKRLVLPVADEQHRPDRIFGVSTYQYDALRLEGGIIESSPRGMRFYSSGGARLE